MTFFISIHKHDGKSYVNHPLVSYNETQEKVPSLKISHCYWKTRSHFFGNHPCGVESKFSYG